MRSVPWLLASSLGLLALAPPAGAQQAPQAAPVASSPAASSPAAPAPAAPLATAAVAFPGLAVTRFTLANGLVVLLQEDHRSPTVWTRVTYRAGAKDDPHNKEGLALTMGILLSRFSTRHLTTKDLTGQLGLRSPRWARTASAGEDRTHVQVQAPAEGAEMALWIQADMLAFHADGIDQASLDESRQQAQQQQLARTYRLDTNAADLARTVLYPPAHPYRNHLAGVGESLQGLTRSDLRNFSRAHLVPSQAILTVVGDFDAAAMRPLVERYFATIVAGPAQAKIEATLPEPTRERTLVLDAGISEPFFSYTWPTSPFLTREDQALDLVARMLISPTGGRLTKRLTDARITGSIYARQESSMLGSTFVISGYLQPGHTIAEARAIIDEEITKLGASLDEDELGRTQLTMRLQIAQLLDAPGNRVDQLTTFEHITGQPDAAARYWSTYATLGREEVTRVIRAQLTPARRLVTEVLPQSSAPLGGQLHEESP